MEKDKVCLEEAEREFEAWLDALGIDAAEALNAEGGDYDRKNIIRAIQSGALSFDGEIAEYTVSEKSPEGFAGERLRFNLPGGATFAKVAGAAKRGDDDMIFVPASNMTGKDIGFFKKLFLRDAKAAASVANFLLQI